jgi:hypothetical protein
MKMIGDQCPGVTGRFGVIEDCAQAIKKIVPVLIVYKDFAPFDTPDNDVVQGTGRVYAGLARHAGLFSSLIV